MRFSVLSGVDPDPMTNGLSSLSMRPRAVIEVLLVDANRSVSIDRIIDELWPDDPPKTARNSVQRFVSDIRTALGDDRSRLETTSNGYRLRVEPGELDIGDVRMLAAKARSASPQVAAGLLRDALSHFGRIDPDSALTAAGRSALIEYEELRVSLIEERINAEMLAGGFADGDLIEELRSLVDAHPYRERLWEQLIKELARAGQRVAALRACDQLRRRLAEVGVEPSHELQEYELELLNGGPASTAPAAVGRASSRRGRRPRSQRLVGRDDELAELQGLLDEERLVSIVGPGGVGKTSLANAAAEAFAFETGTEPLMVRLAEIERSDQVADLVAAALSMRPEATEPAHVAEEVVDFLARSPRLVVLDNAEHIVSGVCDFVDQALAHSDVGILVTSREQIGHLDEYLFRPRTLTVPSEVGDAPSESEELLRVRAKAFGVSIDTDSAETRTICEALEGLPLALELAAAQLGHLGVRDLAERLDSVLDMTAIRSRERRHSSLDSLIRWSWDLLTPEQVELIGLLSVFRGRVDAPTIEAIAGSDGLKEVGSLVAKHLVTRTVEEGRSLYSLSEAVRLFAGREMSSSGKVDDLRVRHAGMLLDHLRQWSVTETNGWDDVIEVIADHQLEYAAALEWLDSSGRHHDMIEMASRLTGLWGRRGPGAELDRWSARCREVAKDLVLDREASAAVLVMLMEASFRKPDWGRLVKYGERLVASEADEPTDLGTPLVGFYATASYGFKLDPLHRTRAETANERAPNTPTAELNQAQTLMWLGSCQLMNREFEAAVSSFESVLRRTRRSSGVVLWSELGRVASLYLLGLHEDARRALAEVTSGTVPSIWNYAIDIVRAVVASEDGDADEARLALCDAARERMLERRASSRDDFQIGFGLVAAAAGEQDLAAELLADPSAQSPPLAALLLNHLYPDECDAETWRTLWGADWSRRLDSALSRTGRPLPTVDEELARWWPQRPR